MVSKFQVFNFLSQLFPADNTDLNYTPIAQKYLRENFINEASRKLILQIRSWFHFFETLQKKQK
jgi:hypothetical protein